MRSLTDAWRGTVALTMDALYTSVDSKRLDLRKGWIEMDTDMESAARIERSEKPAQCPQCGHGPLADIIYGFPIIDDDLIKRWNEGSIVIGGCVITGDEPRWACATCGQRIHKAGS
mgnify:CR=1 FL=1